MKDEKGKTPSCPKCGIPLIEFWRGSADPYPCPACGTRLKITMREIKNDDSWKLFAFLPPIFDFIWLIFFHRTPVEITAVEIVGAPDPSFRLTPERADFEAMQKSAKAGDAAAQFGMGRQYEEAFWVHNSETDALDWYLKSAKQGYSRAQQAVGRMYFMGQGTARDYAESYFWYCVAEKTEKTTEWTESVGRYLSKTQIAAIEERAAAWLPVKK